MTGREGGLLHGGSKFEGESSLKHEPSRVDWKSRSYPRKGVLLEHTSVKQGFPCRLHLTGGGMKGCRGVL